MEVREFGLMGEDQKMECDDDVGTQDKNGKEEENVGNPAGQDDETKQEELPADLTRGLQRLPEEQDICDDRQSCTPFEVHQATGSNMAERDPDDTIMKDRDVTILAGNDHAIRTPSGATTRTIDQVALTYPRADAPANPAHADPRTVREFKAFAEPDQDGHDTLLNNRLRVPGQDIRDPQTSKSAHRRQATERKAAGFKKMHEVFESPLLDFHHDLFEQSKAGKEPDDNEGDPRAASGPGEEEKQTARGSR